MNSDTFMPFATITGGEIVDVLLVAILIYTAIVWLRRTRAAFVARGMLILGAAYMVVRYLDLQMTAWIFQAFFAVFLVMIVVIFQEELRRMFERIAVWSFNRQPAPTATSTTADILVRTLPDLARDHIGALVVISGKDPVGRHITGGIALDGRISVPLLRSLFDTHSPGHDGAVLIENDRLTRFAAHLPLSKDLAQTAHVGTRHSAALGLTELCDALCLVVSEERGTITIARNGRLLQLDSPQELPVAIHSFLSDKFPAQERSHLRLHLVRENWLAKALSICLAIGLWYLFVPGSKIVEVSYKVPVTVENLPANLQLEAIDPPVISATFSAPRRTFYLIDRKKIRVSANAALAELGRRTFALSEQDLRYPKELTLQEFTPHSFKISVKAAPEAVQSNQG
ncbi:MAG: DNA integrity scanning protein DisA nucleotide-binding domain protein [Deltaproteobacteria bacterium]|nr:DNA integrity scanning protein DisA nucleotide-binding domain protein [Deltaproteobacteria bacterium]